MSLSWRTAEPWARVGLVVQFLALIRCLGEYFRLKHVQGPAFIAADAEIFILAALVMAVFTAAAVAAYIFHRPRWTAVLAVLSVITLMVMKATMMA
ncbi:MAG: hypothetical protein ABI432_03355 [Flavobacteriales bacterium]